MHKSGYSRQLLSLSPLKDVLQHVVNIVAQIAARSGKSNISGHKTELGAAIKSLPLKPKTMEWNTLDRLGHSIGQLNFAARAGLMLVEVVKNFRLQDIATNDRERRRRFIRRRFFD